MPDIVLHGALKRSNELVKDKQLLVVLERGGMASFFANKAAYAFRNKHGKPIRMHTLGEGTLYLCIISVQRACGRGWRGWR